MREITYLVTLLICISLYPAQTSGDGLTFSRVTVKGVVIPSEPKWHIKVYEDDSYEFVYRHFGHAEYVPGFFAHDRRHNRWLEITELSTEHARLGRSPDFSDVPLQVGWNFRGLASVEYAQLPLRTAGSIIFPDRMSFDAAAGLYRVDCNSQLNRDVALTSFWVRRADLDALR